MIPLLRTCGVLAGGVVLSCLLACGFLGGNAKKSNDLKELGLMYHNYFAAFVKGPSKADDLQPFATTPTAKETLAQTGTGGAYVFLWDVNLNEVSKTPATSGGTVLAYESQAPTNGGLVLFVDGSVRTMTAAEFNAAPKAQPSRAKPAPKDKK